MSADRPFIMSSNEIFEFERQILAALRASPATPSAAAPKQVAKAEKLAEDIFESRKLAGIEPARAGCGTLNAGMTEAIIGGPLLTIAEDAIRLGRFLELFFGLRDYSDCGPDDT